MGMFRQCQTAGRHCVDIVAAETANYSLIISEIFFIIPHCVGFVKKNTGSFVYFTAIGREYI